MKKLLVVLMFLSGVSTYAAETILWGQPLATTSGKIRSFVKLNMRDGSDQVGIAISNSLVKALGDHEMRSFIVPLPRAEAIRPFNHVVIDWNPHGHVPPHIYDVPHFDIHFYFIPESLRQSITCQGDDAATCMKQPAPEMIPPFYQPTPMGDPKMGWHWFDPRSPEFNGQPFTVSLIYGFYNGVINFLEPMVTREFLLSKASYKAPTFIPAFYANSRIFPRSYSISYSAREKMHYIILHKRPLAEH